MSGKMRDKRPVDELSIEDLERVLAIRKRETRQKRLQRYVNEGRRLPAASPADEEPLPVLMPQQHEAAEDVPPVEPPVTYDMTGDVPRFEDDLEAEYRQKDAADPRALRAAARRR